MLDALRRENEAMRQVVDAALTWWLRRRPVEWDEADHLRYPLVNTTTDAEQDLARACAAYVATYALTTEE